MCSQASSSLLTLACWPCRPDLAFDLSCCHPSAWQRTHTLLITNTMLPLVRAEVNGFKEIEAELVEWLHSHYGTVVELFYAHGLRQGSETLQSTGFDVHQDTEDYDDIEYTIVVKLTRSSEQEP